MERAQTVDTISSQLMEANTTGDVSVLAKRIEIGAYEVAYNKCLADNQLKSFVNPVFNSRYSAAVYNVLWNIKNFSIDLSNLSSDDAYALCHLTSRELYPEATQHIRDEIDMRKTIEFKPQVCHDETCLKCGKSEVTKISYQASSGDEAGMISIKCEHCNNRWRRRM